MHWLIDFFLHLDSNLASFVSTYHLWTYLILFIIIFCETGLVVTPFLPGDSLIFAAAALAASPKHPLNIFLLWIILCAAAIIGDTVNYWIGKKLGHKFFRKEDARVLKRKYLDDTHDFYAKHGVATIVLARFVPIIRTIAPFVAGMGEMSYPTFFLYNVIGGVAWVSLFTVTGYFFGTIPFIKRNFSFVIIAVVLISIVPLVWKALSERSKRRKEAALQSVVEPGTESPER
ncbi:MAG TPA: DedA family protein [Candidatus Anoxymicrobiaceae bacterium]